MPFRVVGHALVMVGAAPLADADTPVEEEMLLLAASPCYACNPYLEVPYGEDVINKWPILFYKCRTSLIQTVATRM